MTILDQLEAAEKVATAGPWWTPDRAAPPQDQRLAMLLRKHAADLIRVARAAAGRHRAEVAEARVKELEEALREIATNGIGVRGMWWDGKRCGEEARAVLDPEGAS